MRRVLVVAKTHLDVGFTDLAAAVRLRYLDEFFPRAMRTAAELRAREGAARLRWTTGSWVLAEALDAADAAGRRRLEGAIEAGDLCWHALPFTLHTEYCDRSLVQHGLSIAAELDRRYDRRTRAAKVTDVPGHTRGLVSVLAEAGVDLLHVGVNPASTAPRVPDRFRWRDDAAARLPGEAAPELLVMYQPGGYGAVQVVPGTGVAVAVDLTGDNLGPPDADDVVASFDALQRRFPDAAVEACTFDEVAKVMASVRDELPVVRAEIGDSWIHGTASDPAKTAGFRSLRRLRAGWLGTGRAEASEAALRAASTSLLLVGEHTWGLDQKTHWPELGAWSTDDLAMARVEPATRRFEASWDEQRELLGRFVHTLAERGRDDLADEARRVLDRSTLQRPQLEHAVPVEPGEVVRIGDVELGLDPTDGALTHLVDRHGRRWAAPDAPLGRWALQTFDAEDFERWFATYNGATRPEDLDWARWDNTKPGLAEAGARSARWTPTLRDVRVGRQHGRDVLVAQLAFDHEAQPVAVPGAAYLTVSAGGAEAADQLELELSWFGLPAARWPVAWWWQFRPPVDDPSAWRMEKLGELVDPHEVVSGGGRGLHAADRLVHPDVELDLLDAPLVAPGRPQLLDWHDDPVDVEGGWHCCVYANLWGTNFPMWIEGDGRARVRLRFTDHQPAR